MTSTRSHTFDANHLISESAVQDLLQAMSQGTSNIPPVFFGLAVVAEFRSGPDLPAIPDRSAYPVFHVVSQTIEREYQQLRRIHNLSHASSVFSRNEIVGTLRADATIASEELLSWSLLYFIYVRVDLNVSLDTFAELVGVVVRTARRYRWRGIRLLTHTLIDLERDARHKSQARRLKVGLTYHPDVLFGRDKVLNAFYAALDTEYAKIVVTGGAGTGKSAFASFALETYLENKQVLPFDFLIWLNGIRSDEEISERIQQQVPSLSMTIPEWLLLYNVAVVIDHAPVGIGQSQIKHIFQVLAHATVIVIGNHDRLKPLGIGFHFILGPLSEQDTLRLAQYYLSRVVGINETLGLADIYRQSRGVPLEVQRLVASYVSDPSINNRNDSSEKSPLTAQLKVFARILPSFPVPISDVIAIFAGLFTFADMFALASAGIVTLNKEADTVVGIATIDLVQDPADEAAVIEICFALARNLKVFPGTVILIVWHVLETFDLDLSWELISLWLSSLEQHVNKIASVSYGLDVFSRFLDHSGRKPSTAWVAYAYGLRKCGNWRRALEVLTRVISQLRNESLANVELEILARLERSIALRIPGRYREATADLRYIEYYSKRIKNHALLDRIRLQWGQIALDTHDPFVAQNYLRSISPEGMRDFDFLFLGAEVAFALGHISESIEICMQVLKHELPVNESEPVGRAFFLLSKCYLYEGNFKQANIVSRIACRHFNDATRPLLAARALNNLALALIHLHELSEARSHLEHAREIQQNVGDQVGLLITESNLACLDQIDNY